MPMATEPRQARRAFLRGLGVHAVAVVSAGWHSGAAAQPAQATALRAETTWLAACWDDTQGQHRAGWLRLDGPSDRPRVRVHRSVVLPTRGHGLALLPDGGLLVAARRPGDWLVRLSPTQPPLWVWMEPGRALSGHVLVGPDGRTVFTTEIDTDTGQGLLGMRDVHRLNKTQEFETKGLDPHAVIACPASNFELKDQLFVANGGVDTAVETGRVKRHLDRMDSSVACLHPVTGELLGQWRLPDQRLSLRHLAWAASPEGLPVLGVALQAEHDDPAQKAAAPLLAVLDWREQPQGALRLATGQPALAGYGGDVAVMRPSETSAVAAVGAQFVVSATRGHQLARYGLDGHYQGSTAWTEAGALTQGAAVWAGGQRGALPQALEDRVTGPGAVFEQGRIDNHWLLV